MISPTPKQSFENPPRAKASFIHAFGYHLAKKMLGERQTNECILKAYRQHLDDPSGSAAFHCLRANWRSNARFPWNLPEPSAMESTGSDDANFDPEALFVDITFDFIVFPEEIVDEGRTDSCHVLRKEDLLQECNQIGKQGETMTDEADSIATSVAIRIGALVALPTTPQITDASISCNVESGRAQSKDRRYQYTYQRGDNALTVMDLDEHCRCIDIVLEEMDPADVARIIGDAFLEGCRGSFWKVMAKNDNSRACNASTSTVKGITSMSELTTNDLHWHLKLHHGSLQADGCLPLSSNGGDTSVEIGRCMLDMILLQSNRGGVGDVYTSVPITEALVIWKSVDPSIVRAVEQPVEPSPRKLSPTRNATAVVENVSAVGCPTAENPAPREGKDAQSENIGKPSSTVRRSTKSQETALFARGKPSTIGGSRKKPKFRLGP